MLFFRNGRCERCKTSSSLKHVADCCLFLFFGFFSQEEKCNASLSSHVNVMDARKLIRVQLSCNSVSPVLLAFLIFG